jgi:hypothetical protein
MLESWSTPIACTGATHATGVKPRLSPKFHSANSPRQTAGRVCYAQFTFPCPLRIIPIPNEFKLLFENTLSLLCVYASFTRKVRTLFMKE